MKMKYFCNSVIISVAIALTIVVIFEVITLRSAEHYVVVEMSTTLVCALIGGLATGIGIGLNSDPHGYAADSFFKILFLVLGGIVGLALVCSLAFYYELTMFYLLHLLAYFCACAIVVAYLCKKVCQQRVVLAKKVSGKEE